MKISALSEHQCKLGEGPLWDPEGEALYWVDSFAPTLYQYDFVSGKIRTWSLPGNTVGSLALRSTGALILAMDQGIYAFDPVNGKEEASSSLNVSGLTLTGGSRWLSLADSFLNAKGTF